MPSAGKAAAFLASDSDEEEFQLTEEALHAAGISAALTRSEDYATAVDELRALLQEVWGSCCTKAAQAALVRDVALAIQACSGRMQDRCALAALMEVVERRLPQAKRNALLRDYKRSSVALRRRQKKGAAGGSGAGSAADSDSSGEEEEDPTTFTQLPSEVVSSVFAYLDPVSLARAACVCAEWRALASEGRLWQPLLEGTFSGAQRARLLRAAHAQAQLAAAEGGGSSYSAALPVDMLAFSLGAQRHPQALLMWTTNRIVRAGRLSWLNPQERQGMLHACLAAHCSGGGADSRGNGAAASGSAMAGGSSARSGAGASVCAPWRLQGAPAAAAAEAGGQGPVGPEQSSAAGTTAGAACSPPQLRAGGSPAGGESVLISPHQAPARAGRACVRCYRHLSPQGVVEFLRRNGLVAHGSSGSESDSSGNGSEGPVGAPLKFWRLE